MATKHRNPPARLSKRPAPDNFDPGILINQLYEDLVEVEALAVTADEAVTALPPRPARQVRPDPGPALHARRQDLRARTGRARTGRGAGRHARCSADGPGPQALA